MTKLQGEVSKIQENNSSVGAIDKSVTECLKQAEDFIDNIEQNSAHVSDLSDDLKRNVNSAKDSIAYQRGELDRIHRLQEQDRKALEKSVESALRAAGAAINTRIKEDVEKLVEKLKSDVRKIKDKLVDINNTLVQYVKDLEQWMKKASEVVSDVEVKMREIKNQINNDTGTAMNKYNLETAALLLKEQAVELHKAGEEAKKNAQDELKKALKAVNTMNSQLMMDLLEVKNGIKGGIREYLQTFGQALQEGMTVAKYEAWQSESGPGVQALQRHLDSNTKTLGTLRTTLQQVLQEATSSNKQLGKYIEWTLHDLNEVKTKLGELSLSTNPDLPGAISTDLANEIEKLLPDKGMVVNLQSKPTTLATYQRHVDQDSLTDLSNGELKETSGDGNELPKAIKNIEAKVKEALSKIGDIQDEAEKQYDAVTASLSLLCVEISNRCEHVKYSMEQFRADNINKQLEGIRVKLSELQSKTLDSAIQDMFKFLNEDAGEAGKKTISGLWAYVVDRVKIAQSAITQDLRAKYVKFMKAQLEAFAEKCQTELNGLPAKITADADRGAKGFMKKMESIVGRLHKHDDVSVLSTNASVVITVLTDHVKTLLVRKTGIRSHVKLIYLLVHKMFEELGNSKHFDPTFTTNLHNLKSKLNDLTPKQFGEESTALLQSLKDGMTALTDVLSKCYINVYDGAERIDKWTEPLPAAPPKEKLTPDGERCAKACLTIVPIIRETLGELAGHLEKDDSAWRKYKMYTSTKQARSLHKEFFRENGYDVTLSDNADSGELNHKKGFTGSNIYTHLVNKAHNLFIASKPFDVSSVRPDDADNLQIDVVEGESIMESLYSYLHYYFEVCHHTHLDSPRVPCSIYEMLSWCCGFPFSPVFDKFKQHIDTEFTVADKTDTTKKSIQPIEASPSNVINADTVKALTDMCEKAYPVLTSILGNGHAGGVYAVEFSNNSLRLYYPNSMVQLLCLLYEIAKRLHQQLQFLYQQCYYKSELGGWRDCWYGNQIGGSSFQCNSIQCGNQECKLSANQTPKQRADQKADQRCDQHPTCGVKSPLQSFLEDGLVGYLPHSVSFRGTNISCSSCPRTSPGTPCKTPMGFPEIAVNASHRKTGKHIYDVLRDFCSRSDMPLSKLCRYLQCLLHRTPQSLDDMWAFYYNFLTEWHGKGRGRSDEVGLRHKKEAFENAVNEANFKREYDDLNVYSVFVNGHSSRSNSHDNGDLFSLVCSAASNRRCAPYLLSLNNDIAGIYSMKYAGRYLSWIVYLTETFYRLLHQLYEECNKTCGGDKAKCRIAKCPVNCNFNDKSTIANHEADCSSIIQCKNASSVLCRYGFTLSDRKTLSGTEHTEQRRTCNDFCSVLKKVLDEKSVLVKLFSTIDEFMKEIRFPFMSLLLALWSLSLLYLLHITVVRLDVLRIRSHLRSPASHRIAAQSLLAAARVRALANVKYFSP
ncbi:hypothetical protein, conserved [Babesia ovata]|uniref:Uncharacterized protein n=1 Tax=Babesia ovata TaxID=189622 RepID=A0A2H6KAG6_9APIC|nr:uncharacterized protein BOVATA_014730 [Babesia ovata]GBE59980.1 hypothetical protein, conserved [Babesia ovata]